MDSRNSRVPIWIIIIIEESVKNLKHRLIDCVEGFEGYQRRRIVKDVDKCRINLVE